MPQDKGAHTGLTYGRCVSAVLLVFGELLDHLKVC